MGDARMQTMDVEKLKRPSASSPTLDRLMRQVLATMETVSQVRAASIGSETSRVKPGSSQPRGSKGEADKHRQRYLRAGSHWERLQAIHKAQVQLSRMRKGAGLEQRRGTREWKRAVATDTRASALVGRDYGVSASRVRQLRGELIREL